MNKPEPQLLHPRNQHHGRYDFAALCQAKPELMEFVRQNPRGQDTIDFGDAKAVLCLNSAILAAHYGIEFWSLPDGYLCPPIPGRADYIHYLADLLADPDSGDIPKGKNVRILDIGTGANCIYPILGCCSYGWSFVGSDIDPVSIATAKVIVKSNRKLQNRVKLRLQSDKHAIFAGVIQRREVFDLVMCNPPFHGSAAEAADSNQQKRQNLSRQTDVKVQAERNFAGTHHELWCEGGEVGFLNRMAQESVDFPAQVGWFSCLVSKADNVRKLKKALEKLSAAHVEVVEMRQGNKISRFVAWSFG